MFLVGPGPKGFLGGHPARAGMPSNIGPHELRHICTKALMGALGVAVINIHFTDK